jgi:FAD-dependent urate hydroxylase
MRGLRVGIVGGGLGGLAAAIALEQTGQQPTVFEQTDVFGPVGAGISLWPNGVKVLSLLGLGPDLQSLGGQMERMAYSTSEGKELTNFSLLPLYSAVGQRAWPLSRAALQDLLVAKVGEDRIYFGARCAGVRATGEGPVIRLADGSEHAFDVVVAADGTHSPLREWVAGEPVERQYVGYINFNGIALHDPAFGPETTWRTWVGEGKRASVMPVGGRHVYAFFDLPYEGERPAYPGELEAGFEGWDPAVQHLIASIRSGTVNRVGIYDVPPLVSWQRDGVVLLGDSAHGMAPDLGQGGCQALEDALVLAHFLSSTDVSVPDALRRYEFERRPRTTEIVRRARKRAGITHGLDWDATRAWYDELAAEDGSRVIVGLVESVVTGPCR